MIINCEMLVETDSLNSYPPNIIITYYDDDIVIELQDPDRKISIKKSNLVKFMEIIGE